MTPVEAKLRQILVPEMLATDIAEYLVRKGLPFRETHHIAGQHICFALPVSYITWYAFNLDSALFYDMRSIEIICSSSNNICFIDQVLRSSWPKPKESRSTNWPSKICRPWTLNSRPMLWICGAMRTGNSLILMLTLLVTLLLTLLLIVTLQLNYHAQFSNGWLKYEMFFCLSECNSLILPW
jgi:Argininosuccinate lyase C-terminal